MVLAWVPARTPTTKPITATSKAQVKPLAEMTNEELDEVGKGKGVVGIASMKKDEKIEAIQAEMGEGGE